jgi:hypothetical protein
LLHRQIANLHGFYIDLCQLWSLMQQSPLKMHIRSKLLTPPARNRYAVVPGVRPSVSIQITNACP